MNKLLIFILSLLSISLEAATITNWGAQLPTAVPAGGDVILMQKGGVTYYFTPNQLAVQLSTNANLVSIIAANDITTSNGVVALIGSGSSAIGSFGGFGTNTTFYGVVTGAAVRATNLWSADNVRYWGAVGDAVTDDTAAFQAAVAYAAVTTNRGTVVVPQGIYVINSVWLSNNVSMVGVGMPTLMHITFTNPAPILVASNLTNYAISNFILDGRGTGTSIGRPDITNGIGILGSVYGISSINNVFAHGFGASAFTMDPWTPTGTAHYGIGLTLNNCRVMNSWGGFWVQGNAEYVRLNNCSAEGCYYASRIESGNVHMVNNSFNKSFYGLFVSGSGNNSHGSFIGGALNHNTVNLQVSRAKFGFIVDGINCFEGAIILDQTTNVWISGNFGVDVTVHTTGYGTNWIGGQWLTANGKPTTLTGGTNLIQNYSSINAPNQGHFKTRVAIGTNAPGQAMLHVVPNAPGSDYFRIDDTNGTPRVQMGVWPVASGWAGLWFGNTTPSSANYNFIGDGTDSIVNTTGDLTLSTGGSSRWRVNSAGDFIALPDNTHDIGATGATRPRNVYIAGSNTVNTITIQGATNQVSFGSTNIAPSSTVAPTKWISVQVAGDAGVYRLPLYE